MLAQETGNSCSLWFRRNSTPGRWGALASSTRAARDRPTSFGFRCALSCLFQPEGLAHSGCPGSLLSLGAALAFRLFPSRSLPLMKPPAPLLSLPPCSHCHGVCVADGRGVFLVSRGRRFLIAGFSDAHSALYLPVLFEVGTV